jgi:spore germination protein KB
MRKEIISSRQGAILVFLYILGSSVIVGGGGEAGKDIWLSAIIAMAAAALVLLMYIRLLSMFPGKDIFDILNLVFGNYIGKAISLLFIWYALHLGGLVLYNFSEFVRTVGLEQTPRIAFMSVFMLLCAWGVKEGIEVLGRWGEVLLPFLLFIMVMVAILSFQNTKISNLLPVLEQGIKPVMKGAFSNFSFPFAETVIFTMVFSCFNDKKSTFKAYMFGLLFGGITLVQIGARNVMVLGSYVMSMNYYPTFNAVSRINIGHFLQRLESAVSIVFLISGFIKISICLLGASKGISKFFNCKEYRFLVIPVCLIILDFGFLVNTNIMESRRWNAQVYPYYAFIFQVILPLLIYGCSKMRYKKICDNNLNDL